VQTCEDSAPKATISTIPTVFGYPGTMEWQSIGTRLEPLDWIKLDSVLPSHS
jgi:hypothetical protein